MSTKTASWKRFPIGELALLKESYMEANAEILQNEVDVVQRDINKMSKKVRKSVNNTYLFVNIS